MRQILIACAAAAALVAVSTATSEAAGYYGYGYRPAASSGGFFSRLMEMERRKNAFLLRLIGR